MPLKRTPPKSSLHHHSDSDIAASAFPEAEVQGVSGRQRPRKRAHDDDIAAAIVELKKSMDTLSNQQISLQTSINEIQAQNHEIIKSMDFISAQYDEMKDKLSNMESERKLHMAYIQNLQNKVEYMERSQRQASIEIRNLPHQKSENKDDLMDTVVKIGETLNVQIEKTQIHDIFRLPTKTNIRPIIIVDFSSVILKEKIITSARRYNRNNKEKLNTSHIKIQGESKNIFITERLTETGRKIYNLSREFSKKNDYMFCWTSHNKVFLRKQEGAPAFRIDTKEDLDKLLSPANK